jgi:hypothetical protein
MKNAGKFYGHLVSFTAISYILWPLFVVILVYFYSLGMLCQEKSGNPAHNVGLLMQVLSHCSSASSLAGVLLARVHWQQWWTTLLFFFLIRIRFTCPGFFSTLLCHLLLSAPSCEIKLHFFNIFHPLWADRRNLLKSKLVNFSQSYNWLSPFSNNVTSFQRRHLNYRPSKCQLPLAPPDSPPQELVAPQGLLYIHSCPARATVVAPQGIL